LAAEELDRLLEHGIGQRGESSAGKAFTARSDASWMSRSIVMNFTNSHAAALCAAFTGIA
jgi:hypothetical protein